jgi:predicted nucleic acid binding AN1-type Zn finger protein
MSHINNFDLSALLNSTLANIQAESEKNSWGPNEPIQIAAVAKARPKRCEKAECRVKIALSDFPCKCTNYYCSQHRHAELHSCAFNFKELGHQNLEKQLIKVAGQKVDKI